MLDFREFQTYDPMNFSDQAVVFRMVADPEPRNCIVFDVAQRPVVASYSDRPDFVADSLELQRWMTWVIVPKSVVFLSQIAHL